MSKFIPLLPDLIDIILSYAWSYRLDVDFIDTKYVTINQVQENPRAIHIIDDLIQSSPHKVKYDSIVLNPSASHIIEAKIETDKKFARRSFHLYKNPAIIQYLRKLLNKDENVFYNFHSDIFKLIENPNLSNLLDSSREFDAITFDDLVQIDTMIPEPRHRFLTEVCDCEAHQYYIILIDGIRYALSAPHLWIHIFRNVNSYKLVEDLLKIEFYRTLLFDKFYKEIISNKKNIKIISEFLNFNRNRISDIKRIRIDTCLCRNSNAIELIEEMIETRPENVDWYELCRNKNALPLIEANWSKIVNHPKDNCLISLYANKSNDLIPFLKRKVLKEFVFTQSQYRELWKHISNNPEIFISDRKELATMLK
jgi:hypothetical protein